MNLAPNPMLNATVESPMSAESDKGFTLVELMVTLAVLMILMSVGVPSFIAAMKNSRLSSDYSELVGALILARSEAVKQSSFVSVCARASDDACGNDWSNGWIVFSDQQNDPGDTAGVIDAGDQILRIVAPIGTRELANIATLNPNPASATDSSQQNFVQYNPRGSNNWSAGTFTLCDDRDASEARAVNLVLTGDIRKGRKQEGASAPHNVFNQPVTCP